ncbi:uncharacterized protein LOC135955660 [Calliphora vicina]|uniref:uncharacterized protein LOC135955660 n=1 Tax=Calliphora vicina TaxID=7373 RepID=UPI00325B01B8
MVPKFDGNNDGDIVKWFRKLEEYTYNYNDEERLLCLKWLLQGTAREFMENSNNWTYGDLKVSLFKIFRRDITREDVYRKLRTRTLKPSESCISYIISMQTIASQAEIEGQELVDIIIDGMQDNSNNISLLYGSTSVEELIACIDRYEKRREKTQVKKPSNNDNKQDSKRCFNCSQFGHMKSSCPKPIRPPGSCFICKQMGHIYKNCPNRQPVSASIFPETIVNTNDVVDPMLTVSVAFFIPLRNKYANYFNVSCLIDSGSPISLISNAVVPKSIQLSEDLLPTRYVGIGNCNVKIHGKLLCSIKFQNTVKFIELLVIPDNDIKIPMILDENNVRIFDSTEEINNIEEISLVSKINDKVNSDFHVDFVLKNNIQHIKVAVASPQANGQVERVNRVIKGILSKISNPIDHADWSLKLSQVEYAINNTVHSSTKDTPSKLLFGVKQRGTIIDTLTEYLDDKVETQDGRDLVSQRLRALDEIERSQKHNENYFYKRHVPAKQYSVGDYVVVMNTDNTVGKNKKFIEKYRGPLIVEKVLSNDRYIIKDVDNCQLTQIPYKGIVEAKRLRKWVTPN